MSTKVRSPPQRVAGSALPTLHLLSQPRSSSSALDQASAVRELVDVESMAAFAVQGSAARWGVRTRFLAGSRRSWRLRGFLVLASLSTLALLWAASLSLDNDDSWIAEVQALGFKGGRCVGLNGACWLLVRGALFQRPLQGQWRHALGRQARTSRAANSSISETDAAEVAEDRIAQIQAAIKRGEEKANRRESLGDADDIQDDPPRQLTPEEEKLLEGFFVRPEEVEEIASAAAGDPGKADADTVAEAAVATASADTRILKTLEFCPDGVFAKELLGELRRDGIHASAMAYDAVIEAFAHRGALDDALSVFQEMQAEGVDPTDATYDALAKPAARAGEYRFVERLYEAKACDHKGGGIGPASLAVLLEAYANGIPRQCGRAEAAFRSEMACAEERNVPAAEAAGEEEGRVTVELLRAVGPAKFESLCAEYGLDTSAAAGLF